MKKATLREVRLSSDQPAFSGATQWVAALYTASLPQVSTDGTRTAIVELYQGERRRPWDDRWVNRAGVVVSVLREFDFGAFWGADEAGRKRLALDALHAGAMTLAQIEGWPTEAFETAYRSALSKGLRYEFSWKRPVSSPNRRYKAQIVVSFGPEQIDVNVAVSARGGPARILPLTVTRPHLYFLNDLLGKLQWTSETELRLISRDGKEVGSIAVAAPGAPIRP